LPGNVPKQSVIYAAPLARNFYHAQSMTYEGDDLAKEIQLKSSYATDLSLYSPYFNQVQLGLSFKAYLLQIGKECVGLDCSYGSGFGGGIDIGLQWSIENHISFAMLIQDPFSWIQYQNELTAQEYNEGIPTKFIGGVAYSFAKGFNAALDVQKGLYADQKDRVSLGLEKQLFEILWLRGGIYQIIDYHDFRIWTMGFGLKHGHKGYLFSLNYHFEYADEDAILFNSQQSFDIGIDF